MKLKSIIDRFTALFYPTRCILCGRMCSVNDKHLCADCADLPAERVYRFFSLSYRRQSYTIECRASMRYRDSFKQTLHRFKFKNETHLAEPLAERMLLAMDKSMEYDVIVPVPISVERFRQRGYNQSELLAAELSKKTKIPMVKLLEKTADNHPQHKLPSNERERNVRGVYRAEECTGLRVLLIDDIVTTGATVRECTKTLYRAGAMHVGVLCSALVIR